MGSVQGFSEGFVLKCLGGGRFRGKWGFLLGVLKELSPILFANILGRDKVLVPNNLPTARFVVTE